MTMTRVSAAHTNPPIAKFINLASRPLGSVLAICMPQFFIGETSLHRSRMFSCGGPLRVWGRRKCWEYPPQSVAF
jgi:hypothetical protein